MNTKTTPWNYSVLASLALALGTAAGGATAAGAHAHEGHSPTLTLNQGQKWATDEALRQGMGRIREDMAAALPAIHKGRYAKASYAELAGRLEQQVGTIVAECKLDARADEQLHGVIAALLEGVQTMQGKHPTRKPRTGAVQVLGALDQYGTFFDHPGWKPIAH